MTTKQLVHRLTNGEKITLKELHRLERRLAGLRQQADTIEGAIRRCYTYTTRDQIRVPAPQLVETS